MTVRAMLLGLIVAGLIAMGGPALLQDQMLYFPAKATVAELEADGLRAWPTTQDFRGLVARPEGQARATAVVFHGNAGHAGHRGHYAAALSRLGIRVILVEYPGYGPRGGKVGEGPLVEDAASTIDQVYRAYGPPVLVIGESLGAGVAAAAAARQREQVAGLLLITPWDGLDSVAGYHYPWLPVRWLLRDRYDSVAHLAGWHRPVAVAVAEHDRIVPAHFGQALYESLRDPKRLLVMASTGHNDWVARVDKTWWEQVVEFLLAPAAPPG
jgi:uncharacterized protein